MFKTSARVLIRHARHGFHRLSERIHDWRYGIHTDAFKHRRELGLSDPDCHSYSATNYRRFADVMRNVTLRPHEDVFADFGSGMGRAVILAARLPFRKVIGIEVSAELHSIAEENLAQVRSSLSCKDVKLYNEDAQHFTIPHDLTLAYFWSPFGSRILQTVLQNIWQSAKAFPRTVTVLYAYSPGLSCIDAIMHQTPWLDVGPEIAVGSGMMLRVCRIL